MEEPEIDIRGIVGLLRRRLRLILVTFAVVVGLAGIATVAMTPLFTASTLILVDTTRKNLLDPEVQTISAATDNARVDSEVEILRSDAVFLDVINALGLVHDPEFGVQLSLGDRLLAFLRLGDGQLPSGEAALQSVLGKLKNATSVQRRGGTYLISVQVRSEDPRRSAELANAVAEAYIEGQLQAKIDGILAASQVLEARVRQARANIIANEERFDSFISSNVDQLAARPGSSVAGLRLSLDRLNAQRDLAMDQATGIEGALAQRNWAELVSALQSDALEEFEVQRTALATSLAAVEASSTAATNLREELAAIERNLEQKASLAIESLFGEIGNLDENLGGIRQQIRSDILAGDLPLDVSTGLFELQQSADLARSQYQTLLVRSGDLQVQAELQLSDSRVVSRAMVPTEPSFPNTGMILLLAGIAGLGLGVGLAFVYENFVGGFTSDTQLATVLRKPVLGEVPFQKLAADMESASRLVVDTPLSRFAESIRRVRAGVDQFIFDIPNPLMVSDTRRGRIVMVSSSVTDEGKTTVALSLARAYAASGKKTLIIDCDLRNPSIHKHLNFEPDVGLLEYLAERSESKSLATMIMRDEGTGLSVLVGSRRSDIPTDQLITGVTFGRLIDAAANIFDVVVLDTPPILPFVDGLYLARYVDAITFVVKWSSTAQTEVRSAIERLSGDRRFTPPILAVLNQQAGTRGSFGGNHNGYYRD